MMSCCGCASRVLKLQSELRQWKTKLADEKREKKMILRWILTAFGYDARVEIEKETHVVRLQATENKEAMSKAIIKSVIGSEGDCGVMLMEVKLEDHEYYEPFEEPFDVPEFPILEINSMPTATQTPLVNTGIVPAYAQLSQHNPLQPTMSITTPMEIPSAPIPMNVSSEQEVLYIAGSLEEGATLEGPNGQSYIIVRANETEDISVPVPMEYSTIVNDNTMIGDSNNVYFRPAVQPGPGQGNINALNFLTSSPKPILTPLPTTSIIKNEPVAVVPNPPAPPQFVIGTSGTPSSTKPASKKKSSLSSASKASTKSSKKKSPPVGGNGEIDIKIKSVSSRAIFNNNSFSAVANSSISSVPTASILGDPKKFEESVLGNQSSGLGLTLREKGEVFVLQKAREAVEKLSNGSGYKCTACKDSRYIYPNMDMAINHAKAHFDSKPYKCEFCDELFAIQKELLTHRKTVHPKQPKASAASQPPRISQSSANTKTSPSTTTSATGLFRLSSSGTITTITGSTSSISSISNNSSTKTIVVQAPFDTNLIRGPISVSNEVLAAILGAGTGAKVTFSSPNSEGLRNLTRF